MTSRRKFLTEYSVNLWFPDFYILTRTYDDVFVFQKYLSTLATLSFYKSHLKITSLIIRSKKFKAKNNPILSSRSSTSWSVGAPTRTRVTRTTAHPCTSSLLLSWVGSDPIAAAAAPRPSLIYCLKGACICMPTIRGGRRRLSRLSAVGTRIWWCYSWKLGENTDRVGITDNSGK